jgi:hypothetical protein
MKPLPLVVSKYGNKLSLFKRSAHNAFYTLHDTSGNLLGFEVFRINKHNGFELAGIFIEPSETMAGSEQFGSSAWYFGVLNNTPEKVFERADMKYKELEEKAKLKNDSL